MLELRHVAVRHRDRHTILPIQSVRLCPTRSARIYPWRVSRGVQCRHCFIHGDCQLDSDEGEMSADIDMASMLMLAIRFGYSERPTSRRTAFLRPSSSSNSPLFPAHFSLVSCSLPCSTSPAFSPNDQLEDYGCPTKSLSTDACLLWGFMLARR